MHASIRGVGAVLLTLSVIVGALALGHALAEWRASRDGADGGMALAGGAAPTASSAPVARTPSADPIAAVVTRDEAVGLIRSLGRWNPRIDRIEAKLVRWSDFAPIGMGVDMTDGKSHGGGDFPPPAVWAVAVAGDTYPDGAPIRPLQHYAWSLWGVNAMRLQLSTLKVGDAGAWPSGFDALADHVAVASPAPTSSPTPVRFDALTGPASHQKVPVRRMAAADADARDLWAIIENGSYSGGVPRTGLTRSRDGGTSWNAVTTPGDPIEVTAAPSVVLVSVVRNAQDGRDLSVPSGLYLSKDAGASWSLVLDGAMRRVRAFEYDGRRLFLAERMWSSAGAATGPSRIFASTEGETWRDIGEVPGPASFALLDVPVVTFSKNVPSDGFYRVEGRSLASSMLVAVAGSRQAGTGQLLTGPGGELWHFDANATVAVERTSDGARTWTAATAGLAGRTAGLFVLHDHLYALGDGAYVWDGAQWVVVTIVSEKAQAVFPLGGTVIVQGYPGGLWRSR